jgi:hypothetical protein
MALSIALLLAGCESAPKARPAAPAAAPPAPVTRSDITRALIDQTNQFDANAELLPGSNAEAHRQILLPLLGELEQILKLGNGPDESPEFKNRLAVIEAARVTVSDPAVNRRRMEAVENQALQSAAPALAQIAARYLYDDDQLPALLQTLNDKNEIAATSVGPIHDVDAANAFAAMQAAVDRIASGFASKS